MAIAKARDIKNRTQTLITPLGNAYPATVVNDTLLPHRSESIYAAPQSSEDIEAVQFGEFLERIATHKRASPNHSPNVMMVMKGVSGMLLDSILKYGWQPMVDLVSPAPAPINDAGPGRQNDKAGGR